MTAVEFEHRGKTYCIADDYVKSAISTGMSIDELTSMFRRGLDGLAKISAKEAKKTTKQVSIDKNLHDKLKVVAEWLGLTPYHALEMIVEKFTDGALASLESAA